MSDVMLYSIEIAAIIYLDCYLIGKTIRKFVPSMRTSVCFLTGVLVIFGAFQILTYIGIPIGLNYQYYYNTMRVLMVCGLPLAIIFRVNVIPKKEDLFSLLFGVIVAVLICAVSSTMTTNNVYFDSTYYLSRVIESSTNYTMGHVNYYNGSFLYGIDVNHDYQGNYYFWGMILRQLREILSTDISLTPVYIWSATIVYGLSLGSLIYASCEALFKRFSSLWTIAVVCALMPFYSNYFNTTLAFFGNTIKTVLIGYIILLIYWYLKKRDERLFIVMGIAYLGILSFSSSGFFLSVFAAAALFFCMAFTKDVDILHYRDWSLLILPLIHYFYLYKTAWAINNIKTLIIMLGITGVIILVFYLLNQLSDKGKSNLVRVFKYSFVIVIVVLAVLSYTYKDTQYGYSFYFEPRSLNDMTLNYTSHTNDTEYYRNIVMWSMLAFVLIFGWRKVFVKYIAIMLILFMTPLTSPAIATLATGEAYCRVFELIANPFVLTFCLYQISLLHWKLVSYPVLAACTAAGSYVGYNNYLYLYSNQLQPTGDDYNWNNKVTDSKYNLYTYINENLELDENDRPLFISQDISIKAYVSDIQLVFGSSDLREALDDEDYFTENFKDTMSLFYPLRDYDYDNIWNTEPDYNNACTVIQDSGADYVIMKATVAVPFKEVYYIQAWYLAKDCTETLYENDNWVLLKVK